MAQSSDKNDCVEFLGWKFLFPFKFLYLVFFKISISFLQINNGCTPIKTFFECPKWFAKDCNSPARLCTPLPCYHGFESLLAGGAQISGAVCTGRSTRTRALSACPTRNVRLYSRHRSAFSLLNDSLVFHWANMPQLWHVGISHVFSVTTVEQRILLYGRATLVY